METKEYRTF